MSKQTCRINTASLTGDRRRPRPTGFSLVEMMVVVAIVAVLATIALPLSELAQRRAQEEDLRRSLREIRDALDTYKRAVDQGHIPRVVGASGYPPGLDVLVTGVVDALSPQGSKLFFLRQIPRDPLVEDLSVDAAATWALRSYESSAEAPKPGRDVYDVHSKSTKVGSNGVPYAQW